MKTATNITPKSFFTVKQLSLHYPAFTKNSLRWLIFNEKSNGFSRCVRRVGRKILIDLDEFESWITSQGGVN